MIASFLIHKELVVQVPKKTSALLLFLLNCWHSSFLIAGELDHNTEQSFHIQAHRGAGIDYPENTLECFEHSWEMQVTPEADLRTTKDGVIVCFHDKDFRRVVSNLPEERKELGIERLTLDEVRQLEVGSFRGKQFTGQRIPTLASVFAEMKGHPERLLYLDIKDINLDQLVALIQEYDMAKQCIFTTKDHQLIRDWKKRVPESLSLLWMGGSEKELVEGLKAVRNADFEGITHLQTHVKVGDLASDEPFMPSIEFLERTRDELHSHGIIFQALPWECKEPLAYTRLLELGVDSFATDYPEMTLKTVREFQQKRSR